MRMSKWRLYAAGVLAFVLGVPLTERAFGQTGDIINAAIDLTDAIIASAGRS
jgi:hypothetical protein